MTLNDLELGEHISAINRLASRLNRMTADKDEFTLFSVLDLIHEHSRKAMFRLNQLRDLNGNR